MREKSEREKWFLERIGKRVFRNRNTCKCSMCESVYQNGLIIDDAFHADYLQMMEEPNGVDTVKYFDTKEEADRFAVLIAKEQALK